MKRRRYDLSALAAMTIAAALALTVPSATAEAATSSAKIGPAAPGSAHPVVVQPASADTLWEAQVCAKAAAKAGFSFNNYIGTNSGGSYPIIVVAVAVGLAESSCDPSAFNAQLPYVVGLWQINTQAHPNVSSTCSYNAQCNADAAFGISSGGYNWSAWQMYTQGTWASYLSLAESGVYGYSFQLRNQGTGTCLDADSADVRNGGKIFQWSCNASDRYQQWEVVGSVGHQPILKNLGSGTCLDADSADVRNSGKIFQWSCNTSDSYQQWWFYGSRDLDTDGNADAGVHSQGTGGTCLDADSANVGNSGTIFQWGCNQSDAFQEWD